MSIIVTIAVIELLLIYCVIILAKIFDLLGE